MADTKAHRSSSFIIVLGLAILFIGVRKGNQNAFIDIIIRKLYKTTRGE
jgi:hypothetical protein